MPRMSRCREAKERVSGLTWLDQGQLVLDDRMHRGVQAKVFTKVAMAGMEVFHDINPFKLGQGKPFRRRRRFVGIVSFHKVDLPWGS